MEGRYDEAETLFGGIGGEAEANRSPMRLAAQAGDERAALRFAATAQIAVAGHATGLQVHTIGERMRTGGVRMRWQPLVDQQFWLFGRDVLPAGGRRLVRLGAERQGPGCRGKAACYRLPIASDWESMTGLDDPSVLLWGFGLVLLERGRPCCLLRRRRGTVRIAPPDAVVTPVSQGHELDRWPPDSSDRWASRLAGWLADYEERVAHRFGRAAREDDVVAWRESGKPTCRADQIAGHWRRHAAERGNRPVGRSPVSRSFPAAPERAAARSASAAR